MARPLHIALVLGATLACASAVALWPRQSSDRAARRALLRHRQELVDLMEHADRLDEGIRDRVVAELARQLRNVDAALLDVGDSSSQASPPL
jgi:hypothetical protein